MRLSTLIRLWIWFSLLALVAYAIMYVSDLRLHQATGFGIADLRAAASAAAVKIVFAAWIARPHAATAGFLLGFDYLFIPLYAVAFYFSAMLAREAFFPKRGVWRRLIDYLGYVPFVAAIANATGNSLAYAMLTSGATDSLAADLSLAMAVWTVCFAIGLALFAAGFLGVLKLRRPKTAEA